jgi:hypothetical protein
VLAMKAAGGGRALLDAGPLGAPAPYTCDCCARDHALMGNCVWCGRVLCERHAFTSCTCGRALPAHMRSSRLQEPPGRLSAGTHGGPAVPVPVAAPVDAEALARKERLLAYDRQAVARTRVFDDDGDYYSTIQTEGGAWLSVEEKDEAMRAFEAAKAASVANRRGMRISLGVDFAGRAVVRDVRREEAEADVARLLSIARGTAHGAHGSHATGASAAEARPAQTAGEALTSSVAAAEAVRAAPVGSGRFANPTLSGRTGEIYDAIVSGMRERRAGASVAQQPGTGPRIGEQDRHRQ